MSAAPTNGRVVPADPADKVAGQDQFQPAPNHRAGYGSGLDVLLERARKGYTLAAGEGARLAAEIDRLRALPLVDPDPVRWLSADGRRVSKLPAAADDAPLYRRATEAARG